MTKAGVEDVQSVILILTMFVAGSWFVSSNSNSDCEESKKDKGEEAGVFLKGKRGIKC